jgi:hypothetical protein
MPIPITQTEQHKTVCIIGIEFFILVHTSIFNFFHYHTYLIVKTCRYFNLMYRELFS